MRTSIPRKFTLVDAMVLIAAIALAFVPIRLVLVKYRGFPANLALADDARGLGLFVNEMLFHLAFTLSLALWLLRLRKPRPVLRRIFRQPGMAACTAALVSMIFILIRFMVSSVLSFEFCSVMLLAWDDPSSLLDRWTGPMSWIGIAVAVAWMSLWLSGAWRSEPSWIDRAGRGLGIYWVANSVLFGGGRFLG